MRAWREPASSGRCNQYSTLGCRVALNRNPAIGRVEEIPGKPGSYNAVAWMRPWLQMEELTTALRMVARIPEKG